MFNKDTYKEMVCPVCGQFYFSSLDGHNDEPEYIAKLRSIVGIEESVPQCHRCGWKYDLSQLEDESLDCGENTMSLRDYREWYKNVIAANPDYDYLDSQYEPQPHICPVCGEYTFADLGSYEICPICGWTDDPVMNSNPELEVGANEMSLNDFKKYYRAEQKQDQ